MKRIASAVFLSLLLVLTLEYGNEFLFFIFTSAFIAVGVHEVCSMLEKNRYYCWKTVAVITGLLISIGFYLKLDSFISTIVIGCIPFILCLRMYESKNYIVNSVFESIYLTAFVVVYVGWLGSHAILLRNYTTGHHIIYLLVLIVCCSDVAALYTGKLVGKHYLAPGISPKKTIEGSIGGIFGSIGGALVAKQLFFTQLPITSCILLGVLGSVSGQLGDLAESSIKRSLKQKDSGTIIPGHGGVLDRIDSILFAAPVLYYYIRFMGL